MTEGTVAYKHRSFSQMKQLRECGYQYKLQRIDRVPQRPGAANVGGTAVHAGTELIDKLILEGNTDSDQISSLALIEAQRALDEEIAALEDEGWQVADYRSYGFRPKQDVAWYRATGIPNSIKAYTKWRIETAWSLADIPGFGPAIEVPFNYYIGDQLVHGKIDRIFTPEGKYTPVDLKSGNPPKTDEQLGLYGRALQAALGWEVRWGYFLYNMKKGEAKLTQPLRIDHWDDEKLGLVYLPATQAIEAGIFIPSPGENCQFCAVADDCPFSQAVV